MGDTSLTYRINALPGELRRRHERAYEILKEISEHETIRFGGHDWGAFSECIDQLDVLLSAMAKDAGVIAIPVLATQEQQRAVARDARRLEDALVDIGYERRPLPHDDTQSMYVRDNGSTLDVLLDHDLTTGEKNRISYYRISPQDVCGWYEQAIRDIERHRTRCDRTNRIIRPVVNIGFFGGLLGAMWSLSLPDTYAVTGLLAGFGIAFGTLASALLYTRKIFSRIVRHPLDGQRVAYDEQRPHTYLLAAVQLIGHGRIRLEETSVAASPGEHDAEAKEKRLKAGRASSG